jgi:hypothetical protein
MATSKHLISVRRGGGSPRFTGEPANHYPGNPFKLLIRLGSPVRHTYRRTTANCRFAGSPHPIGVASGAYAEQDLQHRVERRVLISHIPRPPHA